MRLNLGAFPSTLFARMVLILLAGLFAAQGASLWLQWNERVSVVAQARGLNFLDRIADAVRVLETSGPAQRSDALSTLQSQGLRVTLVADDQALPNLPRGQIQAMLGVRLGSEREIRSEFGGGGMQRGRSAGMPQHGNPTRMLDVRLRDGQWVRISAASEGGAPAFSNDLVTNLLITMLIVIVVVMIAVRQATRPLKDLAIAADTLGRDLDAAPLDNKGPTEVRRTVQAFNRMQARIKRLVDERSRALAAVSHDLRTPLTRLRLRAELVGDNSLRDQMAVDLDLMSAMIDATLDYLRGLQDNEAVRPIDMNALLQSLVDDAAVLGKAISVDGLAQWPYTGRLSALRRALQNLIDNAIKYGRSARLRIEDSAIALRIIVDDEGPGITPEELVRVTEAYYRPDASRSRETGGVGLGLSIVKDIALMHGGKLLLTNRPKGGLSAILALPRIPKA
ncbi:ATP-binding protein [Propionivibrio sp.]|uniref:ATP-binding protein n=1 Tax=Propionivibrio sp. TaxID=2212460 RepID=UPI00261FC115|nr:ATP-binding protein [Propionivibrio sp.]